MKYLLTLIVFLLTASLYAQTPTTVLEGITNLNAPTAIYGNDLYYVSDSDHVYKIDLTEANPTPQAVISALSQNYDSSYIYDLAFHEDTLYLSVPYVIGAHSLTDILKVDLTANTLTTERVTGFTVPISPIAILGDDLYIATNRLLKLNLTLENPMSEVVMTSLPEDNTNENFSDFIFDGNILYMASIGESNNKGVFKVDVAAENPAYEKIVESGDVAGIALNGNSLYYDRQGNKIQRIQDVNGGTLKGANLLTSGMNSVGQLAIHNNHLYIADPGVGKILKYPLSPFEAIYEFGQPMAVHGDDLYYVSDEDHVYKIIDINADNPVTEAVVSFPREEPSNYGIRSLAFHGDMLYVSEFNNMDGDKISRVDLTADPPSIEELYQIDSSVYTPISFLGDYIYFVNLTDDDQHQLLRMDVTAQTPTAEVVLTLPSGGAEEMAFLGNDLYFRPGDSSKPEYRVDVTAETPVLEELFNLDSNTRNIVFKGNSLYYSTSNRIKVVPDVSSGSLEGVDVLTEGLSDPFGLAIHNNHLYIANIGTGEIVIHPLAGIAYEAIFELGQPMAVHGDDLYYVSDEDHVYKIIDINADNPVTEAVVSFPNEGEVGGFQNLAITDLAFHGDILYVSEFNNIDGDKISRVDLTADPPSIEELYQTDVFVDTPISFLGDYIYFVNFTDDDQYQLLRMDVTAQTPTAEVVLMLQSAASDMAFHGNDLYLMSSFGPDYRVDVTAETPVLEQPPGSFDSDTRNIVFQGNSLYYSSSNRIKVIPDVSSETFEGVDVITEGLSDPFGLVIHNNHLYIADRGLDEIVIHDLSLSATIWEGDDLTFTKASNADWSLQANQDRITDDVWITRQHNRPIYNYKWWQETFSTDATGDDLQYEFQGDGGGHTPTQSFTATGGTKGLRWAILDDTGSTTDNWEGFSMYGTLGNPAHFYSFNNVVTMISLLEREEDEVTITINSVVDNFIVNNTSSTEGTTDRNGPANDFHKIVGKNLGVWIEEENIYFTLTFNSWVSGGGGGGFSYTRSTASTLSIDKPLPTQSRVILLPNPVRNQLQLFGLSHSQTYTIYNLLGVESGQGKIDDGGAVPVSDLPKGLYFLKLESGQALKFVKE